MKKPLISVVIPAYNHEAYVGEAISSVLGQSIGDFELIVINDGSTDGTEAVIKSFDDPRLKYYWQKNRGAHHALNRGIEMAQGTYLAILNSDDAYEPTRLEELLNIAEQENARFLITDVNLIDKSSKSVEDNDFWWLKWYGGLKRNFSTSIPPAECFLAGNFAISSSNFFFRADMISDIGLFRSFRYILDYDFAFRAALACPEGFRFLIGKKLLNYRIHGSNTISENPIKANVETFYFLKMASIKCFGRKLEIPLRHLSKIKGYIVKIQRDNLSRKSNDMLVAKDVQLASMGTNIQHLNMLNDRLRAELAALQHQLVVIQQSRSYRLGKALTAPYRWLKSPFISPSGASRALRATVANTTDLRAELEKLVGRVKIVSFDIFDTLLERDIDPPEQVKSIIIRKLVQYLSEMRGLQFSEIEVADQRNRVEELLRKKASDGGMDYECKFSDIAQELALRLIGKSDPELASAIIELELQVEKEVLFVKQDMGQILEWLNEQGIRIIAVSDMYLDRAHLEHIFESKNLHVHFGRIYVSSETAVCKYSGRLFEQVLQQEGLLPEDMVHVGDNLHSDYRAPSRLGIHAIHLNDKANVRRRLTLRVYRRLAANNPYWRGRYLFQIVRQAQSCGFHYDYGYRILGPIYATFVLGVIEKLKQHNIRTVFFLAREGELFLKLFQIMAPNHFAPDQLPTARYLYVSRRSTATPAASLGLTHEIAIIPLFNPKQQGFYSICNAFGLPLEAFADVCQKHGYTDLKQPIYDWHSDQFKGILADAEFQRIVIQHAADDRVLFQRYLTQNGFFDEKQTALVDIGWSGTIQKFFQEAFGNSENYPHIYGLYLGFIGGIAYRFDEEKNSLVGVMGDEREKTHQQDLFRRFVELFEEGARATHPTTLGYHENDENGQVEPIFKHEKASDRQAELSSNSHIEEFQKGILDFTTEFRRAVDLTGYGFEDIKPFTMTLLERAVVYPTRQETHELLQLSHSEDFGYENTMTFQHETNEKWRMIFSLRYLRSRIARATWRYGTSGALGPPYFNMLLRLYDLLRMKP